MLTANLFSQFTSDPSQVARMVNIMSALMSAACILFLFWSITHLAKKLICPREEDMTTGRLIAIMGSGLVGALAYTWSDTFWFSAVEGEVYAYSSLFTALVFWLILKWENRAHEAHSDRWLILIAYLTGFSIGVHLLNLLCIPAIVLVYYYKKNPNANLKGSLLALIGSMVLVAAVLYGIVPGIVKVGGWFELLFVNGLRILFQHWLDYLYHSIGSQHYMGSIRKLYRSQPQTHEYLIPDNCRTCGYSFLRTWLEQRADRYHRIGNTGFLSVCRFA